MNNIRLREHGVLSIPSNPQGISLGQLSGSKELAGFRDSLLTF